MEEYGRCLSAKKMLYFFQKEPDLEQKEKYYFLQKIKCSETGSFYFCKYGLKTTSSLKTYDPVKAASCTKE